MFGSYFVILSHPHTSATKTRFLRVNSRLERCVAEADALILTGAYFLLIGEER